MSKEKVKKPFYKKWWVWLIAVIIVIAVSTGGDEDGDKADEKANDKQNSVEVSSENKEAEGEESNNEKKKSEEAKEDEAEGKIKAGTYKVGEDIPAGEYLVISTNMAYIESAKDSTGELESIIFNDNLLNGAHSYVTLNDGEYFKMTGAEMYSVDSAPSVIPEDGKYEAGMYKVGQDIPAGEYKVILDSSIGFGYIEVSSDSSHQLTSIVTNDNIEADTYITVSDGQYLKLQDAYIEK